MSKKKRKQQTRCKIMNPREQKLQKIRSALSIAVRKLIREIIASGNNTQEWFMRELNGHVNNGNATQGLLSGVSQLWVDDKADECNVQAVALIAQTLAVMSFAPGGTVAVLGTKFMGLEFDAEGVS